MVSDLSGFKSCFSQHQPSGNENSVNLLRKTDRMCQLGESASQLKELFKHKGSPEMEFLLVSTKEVLGQDYRGKRVPGDLS